MDWLKMINKFFKNIKLSFFVSLILTCTVLTPSAFAQNFPHIKTFGYDYIDFNDNATVLANLSWIAKRHDWIVGPKAVWPGQGVDYMDNVTYTTAKSANPDVKIMKYIAYHSVAPTYQTWMENWCTQNGYNPEDLYYHYFYDTFVRTGGTSTNPTGVNVPGYGGGSASTLADARLRVRWNGGWVGIDPSSTTFRRAFEALALYVISTPGVPNQYADGVFLDTFEGISDDRFWTSTLENTIELKDFGTRTQIYAKVRDDLAQSKLELEASLKKATGNPAFRVQVNASDVDYIYNQFADLYSVKRDSLMDVSIEYLVTTGTGISRIPRLVQVYDDMEYGRQFFVRSQTNYGPSTVIPFGFKQFIFATHYLINHPNAHFFFHYGSAGNYGGEPYGDPKPTHWHINQEVNIGQPVVHTGTDYWGASNTDRFFEFASGSGYVILGREYSNALVLAKFAGGGINSIGNNKTTHQLNGQYYPLLEDNSYGQPTSSVTLGDSEGVILIKVPNGSGPPQPANLTASYTIQ